MTCTQKFVVSVQQHGEKDLFILVIKQNKSKTVATHVNRTPNFLQKPTLASYIILSKKELQLMARTSDLNKWQLNLQLI